MDGSAPDGLRAARESVEVGVTARGVLGQDFARDARRTKPSLYASSNLNQASIMIVSGETLPSVGVVNVLVDVGNTLL